MNDASTSRRISEAICLGIVTLIIGKIIFNFCLKNTKPSDLKKLKPPKGMDIAFFTTGIVLHLLLENCGFNSWYCNKCTREGLKNFMIR